MAVHGYTAKLKLVKPEFDADTWHDYEYDNLDTIDAVLGTITGLSAFKGAWANSTEYDKGDVVTSDGTMYTVQEDHITDAQKTFEQYWLEHPEYYADWNGVTKSREWATKTDGMVEDPLGDDYSSKAYAGTSGLVESGSAKEWASNAEDTKVGTTDEYSAKHYALKADALHTAIVEDENVITVGEDLRNAESNIKTVSESIDSVNTVAGSIDNVDTVAGDLGGDNTIGTVAEDIDSVKTVGNNISSVNTTATNIASINTVAGDLTTGQKIATVVQNMSNINTVAGSVANVNTVAGQISDVNDVADNLTDISINATNISDINSVAESIDSVGTVATDISNVNNVADDLDNLDAIAAQLPELALMAHKNLDNVTATEKLVPTPSTDNTALTYKNGVIAWGKAAAEGDNLTITTNAQDKIQTVAMIDAVDNTKVRKQAYVSQDWYDEHYASHTLVEGVEYITDSEVSTNVKSFRNVGDVFYTMRLDDYLNGAVPANGGEYYIADYIGEQNIGRLFQQNKLPYCTYAEYQSEITAHGVCGKFAYDGGTTFKVPTLNNIYIEASNANVAEFGAESLPNITGHITSWRGDDGYDMGSFFGSSTGAFKRNLGTQQRVLQEISQTSNGTGSVDFDASLSSSTYQNNAKVKTDRIKYRAMIQLATQTTDEAIATMTQMRAELDSLKALPHMIDSQPTATGGYNVYSNGYYEEWGEQDINTSGSNNINISKIMKNTNYTVQLTMYNESSYGYFSCRKRRTNSFDAAGLNYSAQGGTYHCLWKVSGFLAEGQY